MYNDVHLPADYKSRKMMMKLIHSIIGNKSSLTFVESKKVFSFLLVVMMIQLAMSCCKKQIDIKWMNILFCRKAIDIITEGIVQQSPFNIMANNGKFRNCVLEVEMVIFGLIDNNNSYF